MSDCNYGCATLPDHQQVQCQDYSVGGLSAIALLECDHTITDFTNATEWQTNLANGKAKLILNIKGEIPDATANNVDNPVGCGTEQILSGFTNTINWTDANVNAGNDDFYAKLNKRRLIVVGFMCEQEEIRVSESAADFVAMPVMVPNNKTELQKHTVTATFFSKKGEIPFALYDAPSGIFNAA